MDQSLVESIKNSSLCIDVWKNLNLCTLQNDGWGLIPNASIITHAGRIVWIGKQLDVELQLDICRPSLQSVIEHDLNHALVTPGLIDCHTHLVYGGMRDMEFELRLQGASYEEIAHAGGGIRSTVNATRQADFSSLLADAVSRAMTFRQGGVTTLEVKSGYGLSFEAEKRSLEVAKSITHYTKQTIKSTYLGAHALPIEFEGLKDDYVEQVCLWMQELDALGLVDAVDGFCENIAFSPSQIARVFDQASALGLPVKLHAEQLSNQGASALAAGYKALSCDHLEFLDQDGITALKQAGTTAVLLPGAFYFLRETQYPPINALRQAGVPIAISTDHNPGTSPCMSLPLIANMACTLFRMTPLEAFRGMTVNAARALGLSDRGLIEVGLRADFAIWDAEHPRRLCYEFGSDLCRGTVIAGELINATK